MYDNYNYPIGADTPDAPWNQEEAPEKDFDCIITETLSRKVTIATNDYCEIDDECFTYDTDWSAAYSNDGHYTILELIEKLKKYVEDDIAKIDISLRKYKELQWLLKDLQGWVCEESYVELE